MRSTIGSVSLIILMAATLHLGVELTQAQQSSDVDALTRQVYVIGKVALPRAIDYKNPISLSMVIATAGGLLPNSGAERVRIIRHGPGDLTFTVITVDLKSIAKLQAEEVWLQADDIVEVLDKKLSKRLKKVCPQPPCYQIVSPRRVTVPDIIR